MSFFVRNGAKLILLSGPRGDRAWEVNRQKTIDAGKVIKEACATMKDNVTILLSVVPQMTEPFSSMGDHKKPSPPESYPLTAVKPFFEKINEACRPHIGQALWSVRDRPCGRNAVYKRKRFGLGRNLRAGDEHRDWTPPVRMTSFKVYQPGRRGSERGRSVRSGRNRGMRYSARPY
ncbi:unnamed protein product [Nippostrongylus brasiliensis]|uniref:SGNH_hydro domain-containing protein n=1 Tax=Nippostrongylus brasiliensis TaxID=27835 RepID=A0A0N4YN00_NIPBR|nr:unnamed protein product [Nippostrongylus brasiliensis]